MIDARPRSPDTAVRKNAPAWGAPLLKKLPNREHCDTLNYVVHGKERRMTIGQFLAWSVVKARDEASGRSIAVSIRWQRRRSPPYGIIICRIMQRRLLQNVG